jgi:dihydroorotase
MTRRGAEIVGIEAGVLREGGPADVTVFDRNATWTVAPEQFASRSRNTPFAGRELQGVVRATVCGGTIVHRN